jgi:hypothetical protein
MKAKEQQRTAQALGALSSQYGPETAYEIMYRAGAMPMDAGMQFAQMKQQQENADRNFGLSMMEYGNDVRRTNIDQFGAEEMAAQRAWERGGFANPAELAGATKAAEAELAGPHEAEKQIHLKRAEAGMKSYDEAKAALAQARGSAGTARQMETHLKTMEDSYTGVGGERVAGAQKILAQVLGIADDPKAMERIADKEVLRSMTLQQALRQRPVGSGPMSDRELGLYISMVPGLSNTPQGNLKLAAVMKERAEMEERYQKARVEYMRGARSKVGYESDDGFDDVWDLYLTRNPPSWVPKGK